MLCGELLFNVTRPMHQHTVEACDCSWLMVRQGRNHAKSPFHFVKVSWAVAEAGVMNAGSGEGFRVQSMSPESRKKEGKEEERRIVMDERATSDLEC